MTWRPRRHRKIKPDRFVDRHELRRLLATPVDVLERTGRCACPGINDVRCVLEAAIGDQLCPWCRAFCFDPLTLPTAGR